MTDFATDPGAPLEAMTSAQMEAGFACGTLNIDRLNWLFQQLFGLVTSYTSCNGSPLALNAAIATCADMTTAIADAIAALPADKFLQGLQSYNATTNVMTLLMNDGTTVHVHMAGLVADAVAEALALIDGSETKVQGTSPIVVTGTGTGTAPYQIAIDLNALATALCANATFQACMGAGGPTAPVAPANAFSDSNIQGSAMAITHGTFTGTAPISLAQTGLPAGVTFTDNGNGTWTLGGTWPAAGTYPYTVTATNAAGSTPLAGNQLISTAAAVAPIAPAAAPFTDTGIAGTAI